MKRHNKLKAYDRSQVKVFCRLRPTQNDEANCVSVVSGTTLSISSPDASQSSKETQCTFHRVFNEHTTQETIFDLVALPLVIDLFDGKNGLLITCGNTGSGKTYTVTGNAEKNGILPHVLDVLFASIAQFQSAKFLFKPDKMNGFEVQSEGTALKDRQCELDAFLKTARNPGSKMRRGVIGLGAVNHGNISLHCPAVEGVDEDRMYAIFVSFIVVYGNGVYDLLDAQDVTRFKHPQAKIVREDSSRNMYVHGVVEEEVKASSEAFQIYLGGLQRKKIVAALLNTASHRFHSVFTIRLVQAPLDREWSSVADKSSIHVSQFCLVDLARPERTCSKKNFSQKLVESGHINNTLTTLKNCFEMQRENQFLRVKKLIPFRDSKLTYLFKKYFEEEHKINLIICLNPIYGDLDEIMNVLKFADVKEVATAEQRKVPGSSRKLKKHNFQMASVEKKRRKVNQVECRRALDFKDTVSLTSLVAFPRLEMELRSDGEVVPSLVSFLEKRQAQCDSFRLIVKEKANTFRAHLEGFEKENALINQEHDRCQQMIHTNCNKVLSLEMQMKKTESRVAELELQVADATCNFDSLQQELEEVKLKRRKAILETKQLEEKLVSKFTAEINKSAELTFHKLQEQETKFKEQELKVKKPLEKMKNILLDEPVPSTTDSDTTVSDMDFTCKSPEQIQVQMLPISQTLVEESPKVSSVRYAPTNSTQQVWLEHRSGMVPAELGTVMQPQLKKCKKIALLPDADNVASLKASKYCLLTQEADGLGQVETVVYKADVVPTAGGGAQFIFNDVEKLRQCSPLSSPAARSMKPIESATAMSIEGKSTNVVA